MTVLRELLVSFGFGLALAALSFLLRVRRVRKENAVVMQGYVEQLKARMASLRSPGRVADVRELSQPEAALLEYFLCRADVTAGPFCEQTYRASVEARCRCGCPSIDLRVTGFESSGDVLYPLAEYWWRDAGGARYGIFPVARGGVIAGIQVYSFEDTCHPQVLPDISDLHRFAV